jgi:hypothetical protein
MTDLYDYKNLSSKVLRTLFFNTSP